MSEPAPQQESSGQPGPAPELERILSIEIPVIAVIAEMSLKVREVLDLTVGSIIQTEKPAEEPLELRVNDQGIGRGEAVRIGEKFGLRLLELGPLSDTIRKLGTSSSPGAAAAERSESPVPNVENPTDRPSTTGN